jgi:two-component system, NarL family, response regulator DevR
MKTSTVAGFSRFVLVTFATVSYSICLQQRGLIGVLTHVGVVRVLVLDEHEVVRRGVIQILDADDGIAVVGEAASVSEAVARGAIARPDVAVVGMRLPDGSGADAVARLRAHVPGLRCLVLSTHGDRETVEEALRAGISGYLLKDVRAPGLVSAVRRIAAGGTVFAPAVTAAISGAAEGREQRDPLTELTQRERMVLHLIGEGLSNRQISEHLGLAEKTVKNYVTQLLPKLGVERRTQAAILQTRWRRREVGSIPSSRSKPAA